MAPQDELIENTKEDLYQKTSDEETHLEKYAGISTQHHADLLQ